MNGTIAQPEPPHDSHPLRIAIWIDEQNLLNEFTLLRQMSVALSAEGARVYLISEHIGADLLRAYTTGLWRVHPHSWTNWLRTGCGGNEGQIAGELRKHQIDVVLLMGWSAAQARVLPLCDDMTVVRWYFDRIGDDDPTGEIMSVFASDAIRVATGSSDRAPVISPGVYISDNSQVSPPRASGDVFTLAGTDVINEANEYYYFLRAFAAGGRSGRFLLLLLDAGRAKDEVWRLVKDMKLSDRVSFIPPVGAVTSAIQNVDAVINIAPLTRWWHVGVEAAAARRPLVSRGTALMDNFTPDSFRLVREPEDWGECLDALYGEPTQTRILCENAYGRVKKYYTMSDFHERLTRTLADLRRSSIPLK
ncbi:MAG: hypothetical protein ACP5O1_00990 [Phycisphaerae bacterium]